jgi:group II intron reverse transcriptase/maturase
MIEEDVSFISRFVSDHKDLRIQNLSSKINKAALKYVHEKMDSKKASGVDRVRKSEYEEGLEENLERLEYRLKRDTYNPQPSRRVYISKSDGGRRPLGISCYEDKLVEAVTAKLLTAVYESKFVENSYGFRPKRSCHDALDAFRKTILTKSVKYVMKVDIKSFFDTVDHEWLLKFLEHDIADKKLIRLINKFLRAGVIEDGTFREREEGTPQGNGMSPVLANVYLHYVFDQWFEKKVKKQCVGVAEMIRYADDIVCMFERKSEAKRFMKEITDRFKEFNLELSPEKTKLLEFGRFAIENRAERGLGKPETFNFLGFTLHYGRTRGGKFTICMRSERKRVSSKLKKLKEWLMTNRTLTVEEIIDKLNCSLKGYYNYYYVWTNTPNVIRFKHLVGEILYKVLNRRSQNRSYTWDSFNKLLAKYPLASPGRLQNA